MVNSCGVYIPSCVFSLNVCLLTASRLFFEGCVCARISVYLVILAMSVDHPVFPIGADLQFEGGDIIGLLCFL